MAAVAGAAALAVVVLLLALLALRRQTRTALAHARAEQAELRARLDELERAPAGAPSPPVAEFVITDVGARGDADGREVPARIEGRLFADIVLRESVVKAAALASGVRRALSAEQRNRIRFEVRRETRRSARRRRADVKEALRQYYDRQDQGRQAERDGAA